MRTEIGIVVFDSTSAPARRQALYVSATAERVQDPGAIAHGVEAFSRGSVDQGLGELAVAEVTNEAGLRLYHARTHEQWVLEPDRDVRVPVQP